VYAGVSDSGLFVSTDNGESWVSKSTSLPSKNVTNISASDSMVVVLTSDSGLFISANNGTSWTKSTPPEIRGALTTDGHRVVAATYIDIVFSADSGKIWNTSSLQVTSSYYSSFVIRNGTTFVGSTGGVHMSKNWGTSWTPVNEGFPPTYNFISSIEAVGSRLFACGGGLWARPISQMTRVEKQIQQGDGKSVKSFRINLQRSNRSEAFVEFKLPLGQHVEVTICTSTGRLVKTLVNGYLEAGSYSYRWDLRTLGAGCYLVNMQTSSGVQTKRVVK
jgi:ligand-binding sensor domain-containing protein